MLNLTPTDPVDPSSGRRPSRLRFEVLRGEMVRAWVQELPMLSAAERRQDIADTVSLLEQLAALIDEEGRGDV